MESGDEVLSSNISLSYVFATTFLNYKSASQPSICSQLQQKGHNGLES